MKNTSIIRGHRKSDKSRARSRRAIAKPGRKGVEGSRVDAPKLGARHANPTRKNTGSSAPDPFSVAALIRADEPAHVCIQELRKTLWPAVDKYSAALGVTEHDLFAYLICSGVENWAEKKGVAAR